MAYLNLNAYYYTAPELELSHGFCEQIKRYAAAPRVEVLRQGTELHKIIMQFDGWKLRRMGEVK